MPNKVYITGLHRAGTHTVAEKMAKQLNVPYFEESFIQWDSLEAALALAEGYLPRFDKDTNALFLDKNKMLDNGFVLHCPGLAHHTIELAKAGKVYWVERDIEHVVTSMINAGIDEMAWHLMKGFRERFPDDSIWDKLTYSGEDDFPSGFPKYYTLLVRVKQYFYRTKFKDITEKIILEEQPYYDFRKTLTAQKPIKKSAQRLMREQDESLRLY